MIIYNLFLAVIVSWCMILEGYAQKTVKDDVPSVSHPKHHSLKIYRDCGIIERVDDMSLAKDHVTLSGISSHLFEESLHFQTTARIENMSIQQDESNKKITLHFGENNHHHDLTTTYATKNIEATAHYSMDITKDCQYLNLQCWFKVRNKTTTSFPNILCSYYDQCSQLHYDETCINAFDDEDTESYTLPYPVTLHAQETRQFYWLQENKIPMALEYRLNISGDLMTDLREKEMKEIQPSIELWVNCLNGFKPLPKGDAIVYQTIDNQRTPLTQIRFPKTQKDHMFAFKLPDQLVSPNIPSLDVPFEQTEFQRITSDIVETANRITLKNTGDQPLSLKIMGKFDHPGGEVIRESLPHEMESPSVFVWKVEIPAQTTTELRYRLRYKLPIKVAPQ